jgi:hypothetical protein
MRVSAFAAVLVGVASAAASGSRIVGFGATNADWNRTHWADARYAPGAAYDADPSVHGGARYYAVQRSGGHVIGYGYNFTPQPISQAKALALREFPADVHVLWFRVVGSDCAQMLVRSATLTRAIGHKPIGDAKVAGFVEFSSGAADDHYSARSVNNALLSLDEIAPKSEAPPC